MCRQRSARERQPRGLTFGPRVADADGMVTTTSPDGTTATVAQGPHPTLGMQAPVLQQVSITTPGGLTSTVAMSRSVVLADPRGPADFPRNAYPDFERSIGPNIAFPTSNPSFMDSA